MKISNLVQKKSFGFNLLKNIIFLLIILAFSCKKEKSDLAEIKSFTVFGQVRGAEIYPQNKTVLIYVSDTVDLSDVTPEIVVSEKATVSPESGRPVDFSQGPVTYTVTSESGSKSEWTVNISKGSPKYIISFSLSNQVSPAKVSNDTVAIEIKPEGDLTMVTPLITISEGCTIKPASGETVDFSGGALTYKVTANDSTFKYYKIIVTRQLYSQAKITSVSAPNQTGSSIIGPNYVYLIFNSTDQLNNIVPSIEISNGASISPLSGESVDLTDGFEKYTVKAENGDSIIWTIYASYELINAENPNIQYTGRIDFSNTLKPKFSSPGVYIKASFNGTFCDLVMVDEFKYNQYLNFIQIVIDNEEPVRMQLSNARSIYRIAQGLSDNEHTVTVYKDSEPGIGNITFYGFRAKQLNTLPQKPSRKIEFIGNSITCGSGTLSELCSISIDSKWYYATEAYKSYGSIIAGDLNAQFQLTSVSGIGMVHSCCNMTVTMPDVYGRLFLENDASATWDYNNYIPDVITICLGQNDGVMDSAAFCSTYVGFIEELRSHYASSAIICLTSPMSDNNLFNFQKSCLTGIVDYMNTNGDSNVYKAYLTNRLNSGCSSHPDGEQHKIIAEEIKTAISNIMGW